MANTTGNDKVFVTPWTTDRHLRISATIPGSNLTFYAGQAVGRDASGTMVQMDDTAKCEFIGILQDLVRTTVYSDDTLGEKTFLCDQPQLFTAKIAAATAGQEGRRVYWLYNNEVSYSPGAYGNYAGTVWAVKDSTHVVVTPPWMGSPSASIYHGTFSAAATGTTTLTKFDVNKVVLLPLTASASIVLPPVASLSPGDRIFFVNTSTNSSVPTLDGNASESINGSATYVMSAAQYATVELLNTGSAWVVNTTSVTLGGSTFTGDVVLDSNSDLVANKSVSLADNVELNLGDADDVALRWDGTDLDMLAIANNTVFKIGTGTSSFDLWLFGSSAANYLLWDASANTLQPVAGAIIKPYVAITDPGNAGAIPVTVSGYCALVTAGAETRTLAAPTYIGQTMLLYLKTDLGDCVVTCTTTINETGNNTITFDNTGEALSLIAVEEGATLRWRCAVADGCGLTTV